MVPATFSVRSSRSRQRHCSHLDWWRGSGRRGFQLAAEHRLAEEHGLADLYAAAADRFGLLRLALNSLSDWLFFPNVHTPERLMRQVSDETRWKLAS